MALSVQVALTEYWRLEVYGNNRHLFLTVWDAEISRSMYRQIQCLMGAPYLSSQMAANLCPHMGKGTWEPLGVSFIRALMPLTRAPLS